MNKVLLCLLLLAPAALCAMKVPELAQAQPHQPHIITDPQLLVQRAQERGFGNVIGINEAAQIINKAQRKRQLAEIGTTGVVSVWDVRARSRQVGLDYITDAEAWNIVMKSLFSLPVAEGRNLYNPYDLLEHAKQHGFSIIELSTSREIIDEQIRKQQLTRLNFAGVHNPALVNQIAKRGNVKLQNGEASDIADEQLLYILSK